MTQEVTSYREFQRRHARISRPRQAARALAIRVLSLKRRPRRAGEWIRVLHYHHVFADERRGFRKQLAWMKRHGDFIALGDAIGLLAAGGAIGGRYFCVTFDDGFANCATDAVPELCAVNCPAAFFVLPDFVDREVGRDDEALADFYRSAAGGQPVGVLSWRQCRQMAAAGMTIGSHTCHHERLADLSDAQVRDTLARSKSVIEQELGRACEFFACPWGKPEADFTADREPGMAREAGYRCFLTTVRGANAAGSDPFMVRRDHIVAAWATYQLDYFLAR